MLRSTHDGFRIAQKDLELRGPGELLGRRQTGEAGMRLADPLRDAARVPALQVLADRWLKEEPQATRRLARYPAGPALFARLAPDAVVFLNDAKRLDEQEILRRWATEYPEMQQQVLNCERGAAMLRYRRSAARQSRRAATSA